MKRKLLNYLIPILMTPCLMNASENLEESSGRVRCGNARFSCLSDAMIRIEFDTEGKFDDRPTLRTLSMPEPKKFEEVIITKVKAVRTEESREQRLSKSSQGGSHLLPGLPHSWSQVNIPQNSLHWA